MEKRQGHFCWCCGLMKPNERFSAGGHAPHLCRDCHRLGPSELAFRQAVRNMDGMVQPDTGRLRRSQWDKSYAIPTTS
jgi:hypothetical protein